MKYVALDGSEIQLKFDTSLVVKENKSKLHLRARRLIKSVYPGYRFYEEVYTPKDRFYFDFFCPLARIAIEVQGKQHYSFTWRFHKNKLDFFKARQKDRLKREWCELNSIRMVELPYNESDTEWSRRISGQSVEEARGVAEQPQG